MDPDHEDKLDFDPLDVTNLARGYLAFAAGGKISSDFINENEQLAFCPSIVVPGVYYSDDKMLQRGIFSYSDTQRYQLGPNYLQLLANAPKCAHHNNHQIDYFPSRYDQVRHADMYPIPSTVCSGKREKCIIQKENNFKQSRRKVLHIHSRQARMLYSSVGGGLV